MRAGFSSFIIRKTRPYPKIEFRGSQVLVSFKNGANNTIEFKNPTRIKIID
jgi:hypothetical protein